MQEQIDALDPETRRQDYINQVSAAVKMLDFTFAPTLRELGLQINGFMHFQGFWDSGNFGEKVALIHSELSEALEANREGLAAEHIDDFSGEEEEFADTIIRILDLSAERGYRLGEAITAKMQYNLTRPYMHGKKY